MTSVREQRERVAENSKGRFKQDIGGVQPDADREGCIEIRGDARMTGVGVIRLMHQTKRYVYYENVSLENPEATS